MKNLLVVTAWLLVPVYAGTPLWGSASAVVENRKGDYIFSFEEESVAEELISTLDFDSEVTELFTTSYYESIMDGPDAEEQDLADTLLSDEVREE